MAYGGYIGEYNGYILKSSLEYAFARYLDFIGANWRYEEINYNLKERYYRPDFFIYDSLNNLKFVYEVKGKIFNDDIYKYKKLKEIYNIEAKLVTYEVLLKIYKKLPFELEDILNEWKSNNEKSKPLYGKSNPNYGNKHRDNTLEILKEKTSKLWEDEDRAERMLEGLRKGTETIKKNKGTEANWRTPREIRKCIKCNKEFKVLITDSKKYCSRQCSYSAAAELGNIKYKENRKLQHDKIINIINKWIPKNKDRILNSPYNRIKQCIEPLMEEIQKETDISEIRTVIKAYTGKYMGRKEFLDILKLKASENIC